MSKKIKALTLTLPIYLGVRKKYMIGMNWYAGANPNSRGKVKKDYHALVGKILPEDVYISSPVRTHYKVYYKNPGSDACNIVAVIDKFLMDALQEHGVIAGDSVKEYRMSSWEVADKDTEFPRVEVLIEGI